MQVLVQLAAHPDEVLTKEFLMHAVWSDTFVGDEVLTRCISEIRRVLEDNARAPRFVQTIPKVGYRLIAPVERAPGKAATTAAGHSGNGTGSALVVDTPQVLRVPSESVPAHTDVTDKPSARRSFGVSHAVFAVLAIAIVGVVAWIAIARRTEPSQAANFRTVPLTSYPGSQTQPAFSPDGTKVAFAWNGEDRGRQSIYVKVIGTDNPVRLTNGAGQDYSPVWSPDGRFIAYLHDEGPNQGVFIMPSIGGPARKVASRNTVPDVSRVSLTWSPDGKHLVFTDGKSTHAPSALFELTLENLSLRKITTPDPSWDGDYSPAYSPDGKNLAFIRAVEGSVRDVYVMPATGGEPKRLTDDKRQASALAWASDGKTVIFSSDRGGKFALWRVPVSGGTPERMPVGTENAYHPAVALTGKRMVYAQTSAQWSIMSVSLGKTGEPKTSRLVSSTEQDSAPRYSPDGTKLAFQSWRSGAQEIWACASDGSGPVQLTSFNGPLTGSPSWSPDGRQIAFDSRPDGRSHIFTVSLEGGSPRQITHGDFNDILPSWSRDMKSIYFASNRTGAWEIWSVSLADAQVRRLTQSGGFLPMASWNGQWLYFTKADASGVWRVPPSGGTEERVLDQPMSGYWGYWSVAANGIYYLDGKNTSAPSINFYEGPAKRTRRILTLDHIPPVYNGLSVAPQGKSLVYTDFTDSGTHITLVEEFK